MARTIIAKNYRDLEELHSLKKRLQYFVRDKIIFSLSIFSKIDTSKKWIRFLFYHHVFDDERSDFKRHLKYVRNYGDFISIDSAVNIFVKREKIDGCYFCITFDDGFKNCATNALPILVENKCPAAFFIPTEYIGCSIVKDREILQGYFSIIERPMAIELLSWDDCRELLRAGMTIGSHTSSHARLSELNTEQLKLELVKSKQKIKEELGVDCHHFACPWGRPGRDFRIAIDPIIVKETGYRSFFTIERGPNYYMTDPFRIKRDYMLAKWGNCYLRYYLSKNIILKLLRF